MKEQQTSWASRGHERKPNAVVRSIYWVADWLGDFGHLVSTTKRGAGRLVMVTVNVVILLCILLASAAHSLELLRYAGASHGIEYVLLVAWEATFIFSSVVVDQGFQRGQPRAIVPWLTFFVGLTFVEASNIIGMADNVVGLLIGIFTPILLLLSKLLLAHQFKNRKKIATPSTEEKPALKPEPALEKSGETPTQTPVEKVGEELANPTEKPSEKAGEKEQQGKSSTTVKPAKTLRKPANKKRKKPAKTPAGEVDYEAIIEVAKKLQNQHPKVGRTLLAKEANTTPHHARIALEMLKVDRVGGETDDERRKSDRSLAV
jgi:hypothetical protein